MDYVFSDEAQQMRAALERQLSDLARAHPAEAGPPVGPDAVQRSLVSSGWDQLLASPSGSLVEAVHVAEAFGAVPVPSSAALVVGLLQPLLHQIGGPTAADLTAALGRGDVVAVPIPRLQRDDGGRWRWTMWADPLHEGSAGLSGSVDRVVDAPRARFLLTPAQVEGRPVLAVLEAGAATTDVVPQTSLDLRCSVGRVLVNDARPPLMDAPDLGDAVTRAAVLFSLALDAEAVGGAQQVLHRTVTYVTGRHQFGRPIGSFQAVRHRIADMAVRIESSRSLLHHAAWSLEAEGPDVAFADIAVSRLHAAETYRKVCEAAIQCHGGTGFTWVQGLHVFYRAALSSSLLLSDGPNLVRALAQQLTPPAPSR